VATLAEAALRTGGTVHVVARVKPGPGGAA
jgi:hypothetical protein